jgi:hypothetical protein
VKSRILPNIVIRESTILQFFSIKDQTLPISGDPLLVPNLGLEIGDGVRWLNKKGESLIGGSLDKDSYAAANI